MELTTCLWFNGQAREAANFYTSIFPDSSVADNWIAPTDTPGNKQGEEVVVNFKIFGQNFIGLNGGPQFPHSEAISFQIPCKDQADIDIKRLQGLRQSLIEKNLAGVYSDEIFKEQNKLIEEQITQLQKAKDDGLLNKYNLEDVIKFMRSKFEDLGKTYQESSLEQIKVLISSIFPSGLAWCYPGYSNYEISPIFQHIHAFETVDVSSGAPGRV